MALVNPRALVVAAVALTLLGCRVAPQDDGRQVQAEQALSTGAPEMGNPPVVSEPVDSPEAVRATERPAAPSPGEDGPTYRVGGEVSRPELIHRVEIDFARLEAIRSSGIPIFELVISEDGTVESVRMVRPLTDPELEPLFLDAIKQWRFRPAMKAGKPVRIYYTLTVRICPH